MDWYMLFLLILLAIGKVITTKQSNLAADQLVAFKQKHPHPIGIITTGSGRPIDYNEASTTLNDNILHNEYYLEQLLHLSRERIPERVVHAKGSGAFGYFEVTHDVTHICKSKLFNKIGKRTPIVARFSTVAFERGSSDANRDNRGFSVKFYTEEGNFDFVGLSFPVFHVRDPLLFPQFTHASKRNPATNLFDANALWDTFTQNPETLHFILFVFSDRGIPDGYRHMPGYAIHTFQVVNEAGESFFVRFEFHPDAGIKNIYSKRAKNLTAEEVDYASKDLYNAIADGNFPSWTLFMQILSMEDAQKADFDIFDVTRILPVDKYPPVPVGKMVLNRNPKNHFAEIEQLAFHPSMVVPGILGAPDKLFEARRLSYRDAQNYRLGGNSIRIPVNRPLDKAYTYNRDGTSPVDDNEQDAPNYYPNSFNGPVPYRDKHGVKLVEIYEKKPYNLDQCRDLYNSYATDEKRRLEENIAISLKLATPIIQKRAVNLFSTVNKQLGIRLQSALQGNATFGDDNPY